MVTLGIRTPSLVNLLQTQGSLLSSSHSLLKDFPVVPVFQLTLLERHG